MQVVAITGANSFIGTHLVEYLLQCQDLHLRLLINRNLNVPLEESQRIFVTRGNLLKFETLTDFLEEGCTVVNLAYLTGRPPEENLAAIANLSDACAKAGIKRLIHCSTAVVSGRVSTNKVSENTLINPVTEYEVTKGKIEKYLLEKSEGIFEAVILRPTAVFGRGGENLIRLAQDLRNGNRIMNYIKSCIFQYRRMNLVCVDNVVSAIDFLIKTDQKIGGETFIISDDEDPENNYRDIEKYLMMRMGYKPYWVPPLRLPFLILKILLKLAGRTNANPALVYDCEKILSRGFKKAVSLKEGLARFSDWYIKSQAAVLQHQ